MAPDELHLFIKGRANIELPRTRNPKTEWSGNLQPSIKSHAWECIHSWFACYCIYLMKTKLTRGNLSCWQIKVICFIFWYENLTMFPTSDWKLEITFSIAHSLSYNILNFGRKWSYNNRDTAQRSLPCRFMFGKKWPPIDITRKYDKLCIVAFNR